MRPGILDVLAVIAVAAVSVAALEPEQLAFIVRSSWEGFPATVAHTGPAALKVGAFWTAAGLVLAGLLARADPTLGTMDALLGGFAGVWIFAYVGGHLLGPIGLYRWWTVWALMLAAGVSLWRRPVALAWSERTAGQTRALLIFALVAPTLLLLQLGCPVPPYMDILATPAAAQRIMTFGWYRPFDSDPYGYWDAGSQLPGLELFYALLGFGSGTSLGLLADTAAMVPMTGLLMFGTYRLGRSLGGDLLGGYATMVLPATILLRVLPHMHGRSTAFVLAAIGLAFFLDERRAAMRGTLGALALATAVATHAAVGTLAMAVASLTVVSWLLGGNMKAFLAGSGVMLGAVLLAFPTVAVNTRLELPYPVLPLAQAVGLAVTVAAARVLQHTHVVNRTAWLQWCLILWVAYVLLAHPPGWFPNNHHGRFQLLMYGGGLGFALSLWPDLRAVLPGAGAHRDRRRAPLAPVAIALGVAMAAEYFFAAYDWRKTFPDPRVQVAINSFYWKVDSWIPWVLVFPTGYLAAWLHRRTSPRLTILAVLFLILFPWREKWVAPLSPGYADPNTHQHGLAEAWAYQIENGTSGFWGNTPDRRWAQSEAEREAFAVLRREIAAGRITMDTHIAHLGPLQYLYKDNFLFSVYTGINDDGYIAGYRFDWSIAGGRLRPIEDWPARLASRPPYIAIHSRDDPSQSDNIDPLPFAGDLSEYEVLFDRAGVRLFRHRSVTAGG